jgi:hypothetical protein
MTLLYGIFFLVVLWLLWRAFNPQRPKNPSRPDAPVPYEIPITVKVSYETSGSPASYEPDIDKDNWEGSFWEVQEPFPVTASLRIDYEDGAGKKTERIVDVHQFGTDGYGNMLIGHCRMRNATRIFRTDRIKKCIDEETGEIVDDVYAYLRAKYESSPEHARDKLYEDEYDTLRILLYVGKADGQLRAAEKAIIRETCRALANDSRLTDALIDELFSTLDVPTLQAFKMAVGRLAPKSSEVRATLVKAAEDMVATQKSVHPSEKESIEYMRRRLAVSATDAPAL